LDSKYVFFSGRNPFSANWERIFLFEKFFVKNLHRKLVKLLQKSGTWGIIIENVGTHHFFSFVPYKVFL